MACRLGLALLICLATGCGPKAMKVSGRVLMSNGEPLPGGRVTFRPENAALNSVTAVVDPDGKYEAVLPVGQVSACVDNRELAPPASREQPRLPPDLLSKLPNGGVNPNAPADAAKKSDLPGTYKPIDPKYYEIETANIQFAVAPGQDKH
ncbi:MAG TPA: carboxypeptidase-like regulatory domain-containing protein, partial [Gemmataceae bacterium]|nr:carboxypeptidase-like regulatory domain-containing protein [Gemmataceae bacterium]